MCRLSSCRKSCCCFFFPLPRLLQCRQTKWISASIPEIDSTQASLRAINLRRAAGRWSLSFSCVSGWWDSCSKIRATAENRKKKPKTKQMQEAGRGESRRDSRGLLRFNSLLLSGFIRNEAAIKLRRRKGEKKRGSPLTAGATSARLGESSQR